AETERAIAVDAARSTRGRRVGVGSAEEIIARITCVAEIEQLPDVGLVIEAVPEVMELKLDVFRRLDARLSPGTILATNTSSLDVDALAASTSRPQDVVGLHFFSPAHIMRLLEIVRGAQTTPETIAFALAHAETIGKVPVVSGVGPGFIGNRV